MADVDTKNPKKPLTLSSKTLGVNKPADSKQNFGGGHRAKPVTVEVRRKRVFTHQRDQQGAAAPARPGLTQEELAARMEALKGAMKTHAEKSESLSQKIEKAPPPVEEEVVAEVEVVEETGPSEEEKLLEEILKAPPPPKEDDHATRKVAPKVYSSYAEPQESSDKKAEVKKAVKSEKMRRSGRLTVSQALSQGEDSDGRRARSMAAERRNREKRRHQTFGGGADAVTKAVREVIIPETITIQELANRMAVRGVDVIKCLMKMDVMATVNQVIDADTAQLVVEDLGLKFKRVSASDVEFGLKTDDTDESLMVTRPPVVTVMGHVDHGKTSLLDALRKTDVVSGEAGGITQHIGAYQVTLPTGQKITFIDTPGHAAFTEMRARGANVTDIVILVVAADDGVMDQTIEAIKHAKAAKVPVILAINKIDKPGANPDNVRSMLLQHEIIPESMGGDILDVEVSAKTGQNLDKLIDTILLQAEILDLKANPDRYAEGVIIESKLEKGRGSVATVLIEKGTLKVGDIFVSGAEFGRVRALMDDKGKQVAFASPAFPVEVVGFNGTPHAGDDFVVTQTEVQAREVAEYRAHKAKEAKVAVSVKTLDQMFSDIQAGELKELPVIVKSDVQGSVEAIVASLKKLTNDEVKVNVLHSAVGAITESDVTLAKASKAAIIGFNVRANAQARESARRDGIEIRYYSIIYNVIDDVKAALSGLLSPTVREEYIGNAEIRQVFNVTKIGKIAGCMVTMGVVKRGAGVRLLRDNVVIHEGKLKTLKRFKDEVKDVKEGYECGMAFESYNDIKEGDVIECYETIEEKRTL